MLTLQQIKEYAINNDTCKAQLNKFIQFIDNGDELSAWQTVLGNIFWLKEKRLTIDINYIEIKANHIGKTWHDNGQLLEECTYNNGEEDGLYRRWYSNGQLSVERTFKNGEKDGLYRMWYSNGQLFEECTYKNGEIDGLYRRWYSNGQLSVERTYNNGFRIS